MANKKTEKEFPQQLYVTRHEEWEDQYFNAALTPLKLAEQGKTVPFAVYELVRTAKVSLEPVVTD